MFNYVRSDQLAKKTVSKKPMEMQPIPQPDTDTTCIYSDMNIPPNIPLQPLPVPPMPTHCMPAPCMNCHCMHQNMCIPPMPMPMPTLPPSDPSCDTSKHHDEMEVAYLNKMYPPLCQKIQKYVEAELNQYDHDLSPIYEMYPSPDTITHMVNSIYTDMKASMGSLINEFEGNQCARSPMSGAFYTLTYVLLLNELYRKRMRRRLYR